MARARQKRREERKAKIKNRTHFGTEREIKSAEFPFFEAMSFITDPPYWYVSVRPSTEEEDRNKIDAVVSTVEGWSIYVQLKSTEEAAERFRAWHAEECAKGEKGVHPHIVVLVANNRMGADMIRQKFFEAVGRKFEEFKRTRSS